MLQDNMKQFRNTNYYITKDGQVFNKRTKGYRQVILGIDRDGYNKVGLSHKGVRTFYRVHRLVAECYLPNPNEYPQINHINGIKTDNRLENLEWATQSGNINHGYKNGLIPSGEKSHMSKLKKVDIDFIRENYEYKSKTHNSKTLGKMFGVGHSQILKIVKNKLWKYEQYATK
jgi:hypothetical protein